MLKLGNYPVRTGVVDGVFVNVSITIGSSGAVASIKGKHIASVVETATGHYTLTFNDSVNEVLVVLPSVVAAAAGTASGVAGVGVAAKSKTSVVVHTIDAAGALVSPASGEIIDVLIFAKLSSI